MNDDELLQFGHRMRREVLGADYADSIPSTETEFSRPIRDFTTKYVWGEIWGDSTLPPKTRGLINIAMLTAMHCSQELKLYIRGARRNGCSWEEIRAVLKHAGVYSGAPALRSAVRYANEVYADEAKQK
ncbi:MAG: carboxymuconolactone decarboxylase family protein [Pseudomonadota bacterium]